MALYLYAILESSYALPDITNELNPPRFLGSAANLNVAVDKYEAIGGGDIVEDLLAADADAADEAPTTGDVKRTKTATIPPHIWPASIRDEPDKFVTIDHPAHIDKTMKVPDFWSPPIHQDGLMTRQLAARIGSCSVPDASGNYGRGEECPIDDRTIYFAIASYRDFQCRMTVESAFLRAKNPHRIRVGVVDQIVPGTDFKCNDPIEPCDQKPEQALCLYRDQVDVYEMDASLSVGPVFARHIGHRLYRGEYYYTQSDAHVTYTQNWDADIISQMEATHNDMAVLTTYLTDVQGSIDQNGHSLRKTRPIMCNTDYEGGGQGQHLRHKSQPERMPSIRGMSQMQPYWAAGYSFSRGHFVVNVPYDLHQPMIFQGEEMSIGIRGFTVGYDFYAPERSVCFHHYAVGNNYQTRNKVPHFWEQGKKYEHAVGKNAMARLLGIVHMNPELDRASWNHAEEEIYGLGGVRTPEKFYKTFGIDVVNKKTEHHLCKFVDKGKMHRDFQALVRTDGMGVDYGKITYEFKDPNPEKKQEMLD